jgi:hypothetical protein
MGERENTWMTKYTGFDHLHEISIGVWFVLIVTGFVIFIAAAQALFLLLVLLHYHVESYLPHGMNSVSGLLVLPAVAAVLGVIVIFIAGEKQLLFRILGEKGTTIGCDPYDSFVFGPIEPLILCVVITASYVIVSDPFCNRFMIEGIGSSIEAGRKRFPDWYVRMFNQAIVLKIASFVMIVISWVSVGSLSILNLKSGWRLGAASEALLDNL